MICSMKALLCSTTILLVACAAKPAPDAKSIEPVAAEGSHTQTAADRRFAEETRGYKQIERNGQTLYCRSERASGSNLRTTNCVSENELRERVENAEAYRRSSRPAVCAPNDPR